MRLIVLIRSFNPRRTQFFLQDIETRGKSFNPRAHTGRDSFLFHVLLQLEVSIHAPTRGATQDISGRKERIHSFNPRAHTGRDPFYVVVLSVRVCFNPRAHTGRDLILLQRISFCKVSIHAPTRGATKLVLTLILLIQVSIHAPTRGATVCSANA